ncbi:MAG: TetR/AcrR family transcriptional regulator, partial [Trebonia sp.]
MASSTPRTKPAEQRRADLLRASRELFLAQGVAATSLEDITSRAGVSKGLFYLYFRSKDELFVALQDEFSIELSARIRAAADAIEDWPAKLDACVQVIFDNQAERHDLHEVLFRHGGPVSASHHPGHELAQLAIRDILADGTAAGAFDVEDPAATAALCWASRQGFDPGFHG